MRDLNPGAASGVLISSVYPAGVGRRVLFAGSDGVSGQEPYVSNGTAAGTTRLADMVPGVAGSSPDQFVTNSVTSAIYFPARTATPGRELYAVSAAAAGASLLQHYGVGCAGTGGKIPQVSAGIPSVGNAGFALAVSNAYGPSTGAMFLALAGASVPYSGCTILFNLALPYIVVPASTNAAGVGTNPVSIPANPALVGASLYFQYLILDPAGPLNGLATLTGGLRAQIGNS